LRGGVAPARAHNPTHLGSTPSPATASESTASDRDDVASVGYRRNGLTRNGRRVAGETPAASPKDRDMADHAAGARL